MSVTREEILNLPKMHVCSKNNDCENCFDGCLISIGGSILKGYLEQETGDWYFAVEKYINWLRNKNVKPFNDEGDWSLESWDIVNIDKFVTEHKYNINKTRIDNLHELIKSMYPDAVSVKVFVNYSEIEISIGHRKKSEGVSMKNLSGEWIK